ncbi:MAG: lipid A biosynthesis acyltransferase [Lutibacter sp.]|uniref:lysophospholipid acyltransferase family protein n=1 Tax=Lutibacter sp. TaxID=1925666 RepID=UPI0019E3C272|nr:lysophospholipid acyltransferase family protein [Lutibacter sp.]NOR29134.1 lipid A biosynthesis acyltransferase [Lutibacter sp.]
MNLLTYILVYPIIWCISILPFRVLYIISDFFFFIIYHIIGYRKKVVYDNLKLVFPEKTSKELVIISKKSIHHFIDIFIEMIKSFTISKKEIDKRYVYKNIDLVNNLYNDGKSAILTGSHYANWEWILSIPSFVKYKGYAAYTKVNNPYFDNAILKSRGRFGVNLKQTSKIISEIQHNNDNNIQSLYGLLSDQSPLLSKTHYWNEFFGVKVPIHTGTEMLAKKYDLNVIFMDVKKIKRGYYETTFSLITNEASKHPDYELTDIFIDKVEKQVRNQPEYYFWTHKRFKHKNKAPK